MEEKSKEHVIGPDSPYNTDTPGNQHVTHYGGIRPQARKLHDPDVTFEEYYYYALKTREEEKHLEAPRTQWAALLNRKIKTTNGDSHEKGEPINANLAKSENRLQISDEVRSSSTVLI